MNLHARAAPAIGRVNPHKYGVAYINAGYTTATTGKRVPVYTVHEDVEMQVQPLTTGELRLLQGMQVQGIKRAVYLYGSIVGMVRKDGTGGDILEFEDARWLVVEVFETWNGWRKVAVAQQLGPVGVRGAGTATLGGASNAGVGS